MSGQLNVSHTQHVSQEQHPTLDLSLCLSLFCLSVCLLASLSVCLSVASMLLGACSGLKEEEEEREEGD